MLGIQRYQYSCKESKKIEHSLVCYAENPEISISINSLDRGNYVAW